MRFVRDNTGDSRLLDDLARLAGEEPAGAVAVLDDADAEVADELAEEAEAEEAREPSVLDDPFVHRFVQLSTHVRRYVAFYVGGIAWILALVLIQPLGGDGADEAPTAGGTRAGSSNLGAVASSTSPAAAPSATTSPSFALSAPSSLDFSTRTFDDAGSPSVTTTDDFADTSASSEEFATTDSFDSSTDSFDEVEDEFSSSADGPTPLSITRSGYASVTGGTPLEQAPPENGLPVAAAGGQIAKFSYLALSGAETTLRLKPVGAPGGNVAPERAGIKACRITTPDWEPKRGVPLSAAPPYDATDCTTGFRGADGIWSFEVGDFGDISTLNGLALVPVADPTLEFLVTFRPVAERADVE